MRLLVGLLLVVGAVYQLYFRYEHWPSQEKEGFIYEHDSLTGKTRLIRPDEQVNLLARLMGEFQGNGDDRFFERWDRRAPQSSLEPNSGSAPNLTDRRQVEKMARPVEVPRDVVVASSAPPVPASQDDLFEGLRRFAIRQVDLNRDGQAEEIIQNAVEADGLLDISIVRNGKEIFYGRGSQISLLPTRNREGWTDIAVKLGQDALQVFRYDPKSGAYLMLEQAN